MPFDPSKPANNSPLASAEMRGQLTGLKALIDAIVTITQAQVGNVNTLPAGDPAQASVSVSGNTLVFSFELPQGQSGPPGEVSLTDLNNAIASAVSGTSNNTNGVSTLSQAADSSYNPQQMQEVMNKLDEFIQAARR